MTRLEQLRGEIERVDRKLVEHISERLELSVQIGQEKVSKGIPIRDWTIEKQVIDRAEQMADQHNLPPDLIRTIMQLLIRESCAFQEGLRDSAYNGDLGRILIVGGRGRMGKWFARFFHNQGHFVSIYDTSGFLPQFSSFQSLEDGIREASLILLATPLDVTPKIYEELIELKPSGIICDIASLKSGLIESITRAKDMNLRVASIHPLFGPDARILSDKVICLCQCGDDDSFATVRSFFQDTSATLVELSLDRHDLLASYVLGLSHIINIIFARTLSQSGLPYTALSEVASTTFIGQIATTISVVTENPFLYYEIQNTNAFSSELYGQLKAAVDEITDVVLSEDRERFVDLIKQSKDYFTRDEGHSGPHPK